MNRIFLLGCQSDWAISQERENLRIKRSGNLGKSFGFDIYPPTVQLLSSKLVIITFVRPVLEQKLNLKLN